MMPSGQVRENNYANHGAVTPGITQETVGPPPGNHTLTPTVASLLGACTTAGFAEALYVTTTATDGWSRQWQYDASPLPRPFVLTPSP